ncbi:MAG: polyribonucleotide nucleotidyltransferase [Gammaproteobacteria bacterium]
MTHYKKTLDFGGRQLTLEYGEIARQANAAVLATMDDTVVLSAFTARPDAKADATFLPLTVDYQEKYYACGRIPGGFLKREGRPSEKEILTSRMIDRSIRPLFPPFFYHEMQVLATVLSYNPEMDSDILAMIASYAAVHLAGVPCGGPLAAAKVAHVNGELVVNPSQSQMAESALELVVAGTRGGVVMVESSANELSEATMLKAVTEGHKAMLPVLDAVEQLAENAKIKKWDWQPPKLPAEQLAMLKDFDAGFAKAYSITDKQERGAAIASLRESAVVKVLGDNFDAMQKTLLNAELKKMESAVVRRRVLGGEARIDQRSTRDIRPISIRLGVLPRTHGSALFTRGETQALAITTLGADNDDQKIDALAGEQFERFMLHYNFPPYSTGETGRTGIPKRREVGHGRLAKRALSAVLPSRDDFRFSLRVVSEITESNGSSSMATVCGGSLSMMDAGVPLRSPVAGIAMGLIKEGNNFAVLSDILGDEDHLGDMDFKVAGTTDGITALQMDLKIDSVNEQIMAAALEQAREGRAHILGEMAKVLAAPRSEVSAYAPRMLQLKIPVDKIRDVIGKGGSVIKNLQETTTTRIDISDDGTVVVTGKNLESCESARDKIQGLTRDIEVGRVYDGKVENILENVGAIISVLPGRDGLLHISQISDKRIGKVSDYLETGQTVKVKVLKSEGGRVRFTMRYEGAETLAAKPGSEEE